VQWQRKPREVAVKVLSNPYSTFIILGLTKSGGTEDKLFAEKSEN